eukprot:8192761-Pyramimonas_sp.AAC.1
MHSALCRYASPRRPMIHIAAHPLVSRRISACWSACAGTVSGWLRMSPGSFAPPGWASSLPCGAGCASGALRGRSARAAPSSSSRR